MHAAAVDALTLDGGLDWTGLDWRCHACCPQGIEGSTPCRTCYKVARSKQGITASSSLTCSDTAIAELCKGSNTLPTDSTNLQVTMQHKSGTALIWRDRPMMKLDWAHAHTNKLKQHKPLSKHALSQSHKHTITNKLNLDLQGLLGLRECHTCRGVGAIVLKSSSLYLGKTCCILHM